MVMLDIVLGGKSRNCNGVTRRDVLRIGALTAGGVTLGGVLRARAADVASGKPSNGKSVICFWLDGGPTHMETFDPKPEAPAEYKGPYDAIETNVPGIQINEFFKKTSQVMDKVSLIRSVHHNNGDHFAAAHWMWTGYHGSSASRLEPMYPSIGAIISKTRGSNRSGMPAFVSVPYAMTIGRKPGYQSSAFLGVAFNPFDVGGDPNRKDFKVQNVSLPKGVTAGRTMNRKILLEGLDRVRREVDNTGLMDGIDEFNRQACGMVTGGEAPKAFDINTEDPRLRDQYGRNSVGQGALLARRLVEAGVTFVTVHSGGWDNHSNIEGAMRGHGPRMDAAISSLVSDLDQRGMLDDVMILVMGEFGRTPRMNSGRYAKPGRDHWGNVMSVMLGGGGLKGGVVVGSSDAKGTRPLTRAVKPAHVLHTVYRQLGIDTHTAHIDRSGRPIPILGEGEPIRELA
jgi:uncharacterized protein (DUF1501 family)